MIAQVRGVLVGSIANLIVADLVAKKGIHLGWRRHALTGLPITLMSLIFIVGSMR